ncbi:MULTISPECIES: hypothetical protein [Ralstonia solanacearum species complex]|uniref:Nicotinate-nucleotide diphosphorylase (Carboxylating) n=4 Tax=Ralstonia solanacearum species complex TaxID=3116862 RepID=A0A0K1ZR67_RALSL|nr:MULTISPECIES: hypothetical protein [Ralstonia]AKZ28352.1 hypothetical protein ACH51_18440 [Ralstonia solanacearum]APC65998.1 hypothetical protein RSOE_00990 [Ralstonia solanacearum OE1-1]AGH86203.1 hypothetical protein F504_3691 [Ralstonia pseudosolanacearum FQY_4]ANH34928.1 hypothetical protein A3768_4101 [Ralstonia solanacearum]AOE92511.1 hypothetical protein LBM341_04261 [Ralstonia solanacearum]
MTEDLLVQLIAEIEKEDPVDFANLPFDEQMLRNLVCKLVAHQLSQMEAAHFSQDDVIASLSASIAKLVLENLVLNARLLTLQGHGESARELLERIARQARG